MIQLFQFSDTADPISVVLQLIHPHLQRQIITLSAPESLIPRQRPRPATTYNTINHFRPSGSGLSSHQEGWGWGEGVMLVEGGGGCWWSEGGGRGENNSNHATQYNPPESVTAAAAGIYESKYGRRPRGESSYSVHRFGGALTKLSD